ncbi:thiol reductant ABC exporter subunit CydC [Demequina sp.]|uniref:thiol reductant ABC exporter subunit CydC n=1 Tax=Demequina sp. TaxID=2050685 RepID=UPI003D0D040A
MTPRSALREAIRDTGITWWGYARSVLAGSAALGSAVGLAAVAAWLIGRAAQLPSPADLALAAVAVRFFGIGRGLFRYVERLLSHDTALRGVVTLRERTYERLAGASARSVLSLRRGDIVARAGADLDAVGDVVVRSLIPFGVAVTISAVAAGIVLWQLPIAGAALALALILAGVVPAVLTARQARIAADAGVAAAAEVSAAALSAIESSAEHRVWDEDGAALDALRRANRASEGAADAAARPASLAAASQTLFSGLGLIACLALAVTAARNGDISGPAAAIVALTPLAAFEAVGAIPAAIMQYYRSSAAALRLAQMSDEPEATTASGIITPATLELTDLSVGWPGAKPTPPVTGEVTPGSALALVGRSGVGKTTLLLTITGALPAVAGGVTYGGKRLTPADAGAAFALTLEDAHLFGTTVLENLRVARAGITDDDAWEALERVGLAEWVRALPAGLDTELGTGGHTVSGGERRRLLMARALLADVPLQLLDEPGEHLDTAGIAAFGAAVEAMRAQGRTVVIVTHDDEVMAMADAVVTLDGE